MRPVTSIFKTTQPDHIRHTVLIAFADPTKNRYFTRQVFGARADWQEITEADFQAIDTRGGSHANVLVTDADLRDLDTLPKPTTLLQKLVRAVEGKGAVASSVRGTIAPRPVAPAVAPVVNNLGHVMAMSVPEAVILTPAPTVDVEAVEFLAERAKTPLEDSLDASGKPLPVQSHLATHEEYATLETPTASTKGILSYISRTVHGLPEDDGYQLAQNLSQSICINGGAGTGKTSSARVQAYKRGVPFVQFEWTPATTIAEVIGRFVATRDKGVALWRHSELVTAIQQPSVVLLNELTRMSPRSASYFLRLLEEREVYVPELGRVIKVHPQCILVADMNTGYRGTQSQDEALLSRFNHKWEFEYDRKIEAHFIPSENLLDLATKLRGAYSEKRLHTPFTTRMLNNFVSQAPASFSYAVGMLVNCYPAGEERQAVLDAVYTHADGIAKDLGVALGEFVIPDIEKLAPQESVQ
jgi:hypothetical protein